MSGFKNFILRGNLVELAVAFVMGAAFATVVTATVALLMDVVGKIGGSANFSGYNPGGVSVGAWITAVDPNKNWQKLLSMFAEVKSKNPRVKLAIVSDITTSPDVDLFYIKALQYNLLEDLILLPNVPYEKMPSYYSLITQSGGVILSTSFSEGYPLNLLEAQACECPIVCTEIEGSKEIVKDKRTGFTFPVTNDGIGILSILTLLDDDKLRKEFGKEARNVVCLKNNLDENIRSYLNWTSSLLSH